MKKSNALTRSATTGRFVTRPLGKSKAMKFAKVEGVTISSKSANTLKTYTDRGLKGDALRSAITGRLVTKNSK